ncbi:MAG: nucleotidyltransferase, partial [Acidimicrobiales bacterium]
YAVYDALRCGFDDVVFVVSEESAEAVEAQVTAGCGRHVPVRYALQKTEGREKPWGTGHAVLTACTEVDGPFGVINADDFYGHESFQALGRTLADDPEHHVLVAFRLRESLSPNGGVSRGVCVVEDGFLASISERHDVRAEDGAVTAREGVALTGDELISTNLWGFQQSFCPTLAGGFERFTADQGDDPGAEFLIGDAVASLGRRRVRVVPTSERFIGVTYADDVAGARASIADLVAAGRYPSPLWE